MISKRCLLMMALALVMAQEAAQGQGSVRWTSYKMSDGLCEPVCDSLWFTPQGKLLASRIHAAQASELDGYSASNFPAPPENFGRICESPGGQRWALSADGLLEMKNETWLTHPVPAIAAAPKLAATRATLFLPVRQGCVLFLLPDKLMEYVAENPDRPKVVTICTAAETGIEDFISMAVTADEGLWICGSRGLVKFAGPARNLEPHSRWQTFMPPAAMQLADLSRPVADASGAVTLIAESSATHERVAVTFDGHEWTACPGGTRRLSRAWRAANRKLWAATSNTLFEWQAGRTNWVEHGEISVSQIFDVAVEPGGAFWLATSDGLFRGSPPLWSRPEELHDLDTPARAICAGANGGICFVAGNRLHLLHNADRREFELPPSLQLAEDPPLLVPLHDGSLLIGVAGVIYKFDSSRGDFNRIEAEKKETKLGLLGLLPSGNACIFRGGNQFDFAEYDGQRLRPLSNPPPFQAGDEPAELWFTARNTDCWVAGQRGLAFSHDGKWRQFSAANNGAPASAVGFAEENNGKILCATADELWEFNGENWALTRSRFNHINALTRSRDGTIWLASNSGLFRFFDGIWLENGGEEGLPYGSMAGLCEDRQGVVWAGGSHGISRFNSPADADPPKTSIRWLGGNRHRLAQGDALNLFFEGQDKWKQTSRERLFYSYQADQHGWSAFQDSAMFSVPQPVAGHHVFQLRALDRNGNVGPLTATINFTVVTPWFRETRLWVILLLGVAAAVFFAAVAWNRHRQLVLSYAEVEKKVAERTRELEIATRELMHSQKMNALGTLAAGIAHDFNNILSIIKGSAQIIEDNTDQPEKIRTRVGRIKTVVQQGAEIVDAMLGFGRNSDTTPAACDINTVVADTVRLLGDRFLREVEVKFERAEKLPEISTSREFIQQILLNFIFNAAEAMQGQKQIILTTRLTGSLPGEIFLPPAAPAPFILISVQDAGSGIAPEVKARIFEPFFTTKAMSARRGTGLGLSMVYELAKKLGAGLAVHSVVGQGSTFTLILPAPEKQATTPGKSPPAQTEILHK